MKASEEEASVPWQGEDAAIHGAIAGQGHKHRHSHGEVSHQLLCKSLWQVQPHSEETKHFNTLENAFLLYVRIKRASLLQVASWSRIISNMKLQQNHKFSFLEFVHK